MTEKKTRSNLGCWDKDKPWAFDGFVFNNVYNKEYWMNATEFYKRQLLQCKDRLVPPPSQASSTFTEVE